MKTHVTFVLDSSGSMSSIEDDTKGGFNVFLADQQDGEGQVTVTLYEFNTNVELVYHEYPIVEAPKLTDANYTPGGRTALYDALASAISTTVKAVESGPVAERPDNVIVVVLTDGKENASETTQTAIREQVEECQEERGWEFLFIGANQDATLTARGMGMDEDRALSMAYNDQGTRAAYESTSERVRNARQTGTTGEYTQEDRDRQDRAGQ
jgi:Mg-chelatase subunit ChlD